MLKWIKRNKLSSVLILFLVLWVVVKPWLSAKVFRQMAPLTVSSINYSYDRAEKVGSSLLPPDYQVPPSTKTDRLVVQESNLSLVVKNVRQAVDQILAETKNLEGYMVSSSLSQPEEAPYATLVIRVPAKNLQATLKFLRSQALKVTSENLVGTDVTDQYEDIAARLQTLNKTKAKFEEILDKATQVQDILTVQRELINLQSQIDGLKGQQQYLEKIAELSRITIYLSTDEFALPYAPATPFRPAVIFKQAVRSLVGTLRSAFKAVIWLGVYSVLIIPVALVIWIVSKRFQNSSSQK